MAETIYSKTKLEKDIQREICEWLDEKKMFFWRSNNIPVFGMSNDGQKRFRSLPKYTPRGLPDIIVIHKGIFIGIEVKRFGEKQKPDQIDMEKKIVENGGLYILAYHVMDVKGFLEFRHLL